MEEVANHFIETSILRSINNIWRTIYLRLWEDNCDFNIIFTFSPSGTLFSHKFNECFYYKKYGKIFWNCIIWIDFVLIVIKRAIFLEEEIVGKPEFILFFHLAHDEDLTFGRSYVNYVRIFLCQNYRFEVVERQQLWFYSTCMFCFSVTLFSFKFSIILFIIEIR